MYIFKSQRVFSSINYMDRFEIRVIFGVRFERRKVDFKKANLHEN